MCHILGIEPQFENIIKNGPFIPMTTGQRKPEGQWTGDERKDANLDQRLKSLIKSVLPDDQMNFDFQDSLDDEEDTRSSHEYLNDLEEEYQARALLAKSKMPTKDFEAKYNKVKAKLALLSSSASASKAATIKNKCLIAEAYEWDEEEVSLDDNEMVEIKVLMALAEENDAISKEGARNGKWVKISMRKSYLYKYVEQPGPKVVFGDDCTCTTEGYGAIKSIAIACYTQNRSTIVKRHLKTPYEIFHKRIPNINFLHVFGCPIYIHNHKDHLGKFDEKADDGYLIGYSLVSKAFIVFNIRRQQTEETYHIIFDESPYAIKFLKPSVDNINIAKHERYPLNEYLHLYEPSQRYQTNSNDVSFIEPYECPKPVVLETEVSSDQNGQTNQNDQSIQNDKILNDSQSEHSNHTNDEQIINNLPNTEDIQIPEHSSSLSVEDTLIHNIIPIPNPSLSIPSMVTPAPQDRWSQDKHIKLVKIIGNPGAGMLTRAMAKELSAASAH
ncbi:retrovirus-related pol polyprotein from transposon TNT 1-94 [Tanacetum coccineum]